LQMLPDAISKPDPARAGAHILIAEDSRTQAEQLQHVLAAHGHRVTVAGNGRQALDAMRAQRPAVLISDVVMPEMDGYELCRAVHADPLLCDIPVILLTSLSDPENVVRGLDCGADNFVLKPYDPEFLCSRVQYTLMNQELRRDSIAEMGLEIFFAGRKHFVTSDRMQIVDLLFSTFENAVQKAREFDRAQHELSRTRARITDLEQRIAHCSTCSFEAGQTPSKQAP